MKHMISKSINAHELIDYFVDFLLIGRKQNEMILLNLPPDNDQTIREKIKLLQTKKKCLTKGKIAEKGVETIQRFVQETLATIDDTDKLVQGQL
jgi:hypothetical protein